MTLEGWSEKDPNHQKWKLTGWKRTFVKGQKCDFQAKNSCSVYIAIWASKLMPHKDLNSEQQLLAIGKL